MKLSVPRAELRNVDIAISKPERIEMRHEIESRPDHRRFPQPVGSKQATIRIKGGRVAVTIDQLIDDPNGGDLPATIVYAFKEASVEIIGELEK